MLTVMERPLEETCARAADLVARIASAVWPAARCLSRGAQRLPFAGFFLDIDPGHDLSRDDLHLLERRMQSIDPVPLLRIVEAKGHRLEGVVAATELELRRSVAAHDAAQERRGGTLARELELLDDSIDPARWLARGKIVRELLAEALRPLEGLTLADKKEVLALYSRWGVELETNGDPSSRIFLARNAHGLFGIPLVRWGPEGPGAQLLGGMEKLLVTILEQCEGNLPMGLVPLQARVLAVSSAFSEHAGGIVERLRSEGLRTDLDAREESVAYRTRSWEKERIPYLLLSGEREARQGKITLRRRHRPAVEELVTLEQFLTEARGAVRPAVKSGKRPQFPGG